MSDITVNVTEENINLTLTEVADIAVTVAPDDPIALVTVAEQGPRGVSPTVSVGTVTTGNPGTSATVTNSGTPTAAVFDFVIPRGADGSSNDDQIYVQATDPEMSGTGLWIQTGLGAGTDMTFWVEDGQ